MIVVRPINLQQAEAFMREAGYGPPRERDLRVFLATCLGDDIQLLDDGSTRVLFVLRHIPDEQITKIRAAVKQGPGDAMQIAYTAVQRGDLFVFPTVQTDVPADRLRNKLLTFTTGAAQDTQTVRFMANLTPMEGANV